MGSVSRGYCSTPASCESLFTTASKADYYLGAGAHLKQASKPTQNG